MSDNIVLELLRAIRGDLSNIKADVIELKERMGLLEAQYSSLSRRVDRMGGDVEQIKRRLEIADAPASA